MPAQQLIGDIGHVGKMLRLEPVEMDRGDPVEQRVADLVVVVAAAIGDAVEAFVVKGERLLSRKSRGTLVDGADERGRAFSARQIRLSGWLIPRASRHQAGIERANSRAKGLSAQACEIDFEVIASRHCRNDMVRLGHPERAY
ncbi:hypothetical protein [Novosphingobium mathurense]|uniref:hypothetical protein n=1 Tax=Novosphingobium mathurense TaxID=428990 RepID=UPI001FEB533E|nr:hypothetical protein [Novosphingobium mathurense]